MEVVPGSTPDRARKTTHTPSIEKVGKIVGDIDLFAGGAPGFKFDEIGDTASGVILSYETKQRRQYYPDKVGGLLYWSNVGGKNKPVEDAEFDASGKPNSPVDQLVVEVDTGKLDPKIDGDDGVRSLYLNNKSKKETFAQALKDGGVRTMQGMIGAYLEAFTFVATRKGKGPNPMKVYEARVSLKVPASFESKRNLSEDSTDEIDDFDI